MLKDYPEESLKPSFQVSTRESYDDTVRQMLNGNFCPPANWSDFLRFCDSHHIVGFVAKELKRHEYQVPKEARQTLRRMMFRQIHENESLVRSLENIAEFLNCPWLLLKGPHVAVEYFGGLQQRHIADLDILVPTEFMSEAEHSLQSEGFQCDSKFLLGKTLSETFLHALEYSGSCRLDLHRRLRVLPWLRLSEKDCFLNSQTWHFRQNTYRVPDQQGTLLLYLLGLHDDLGRGEWKWKHWIDLCILLSKLDANICWTTFFERMDEVGLGLMSRSVIAHCLSLFRSQGLCVTNFLDRPDYEVAILRGLSKYRSRSASRLLWAKLFDAPWPLPMAWWICSLPFRYYAHRLN